MIRYNGLYISPRASNVSGHDILLELQVPSGTIAEIIRVWFDPTADGGDEILRVTMYGIGTSASGGTDYTPLKMQGQSDSAAACTLKSNNPTSGGTPPLQIYQQFHSKVGWLYLPQPDERPRIVGGSAIDNFGLRFTATPTASPLNATFGILWGEIT